MRGRGLPLVLLSAAVMLVLSGCGINAALEEVRQAEIAQIDLQNLPDGLYRGSWDAEVVTAEVEVRIDEGAIAEIRLLSHNNGRGGPAEAIITDVKASQSLQVDTVSGATISSKVILLAILDALEM